MTVTGCLDKFWSWLGSLTKRDLRVLDGEGVELPDYIPRKILVRQTLNGRNWMAGLNCPCGCGEVIQLMLLEGMSPRWKLTIDSRNRPTLHPSVWVVKGCRSHFWVRAGRILWCQPVS
ncbi:DUF6527 family protein [Lysobacter gummosus]|jgi:hypothetical protein|uniref:DUF6527 family protein n=1 Tax=Lysobacter gummosus TaxID=262324 RepID=UPI00363BF0C3